jgi:hypothetical protein
MRYVIAVVVAAGSEMAAMRGGSLLVSSWRSVDCHYLGHESETMQLMRQSCTDMTVGFSLVFFDGILTLQ